MFAILVEGLGRFKMSGEFGGRERCIIDAGKVSLQVKSINNLGGFTHNGVHVANNRCGALPV